MPSVVVGEGAVDIAVIRAIVPALEVPKPEETLVGREGAIRRAAAAAKMLDRKVVLVLDRNGFSAEQLDAELHAALRKSWGGEPNRDGPWWLHGSSAVRLVIAGLPEDPVLTALRVRKFAMDDYLVLLCLDGDAWGEFCRRENLAHRPKSADLRAILDELVGTLRARGIEIDSSKRYMDLVRAIVGFQASRTKFAEELIRTCPAYVSERVLGPLARKITTDPPLAFPA